MRNAQHAAALAAVVVAGLLAAPAATSAATLEQKERHLVRTIEQAKTTLRWFEKHPQLIYARNPIVRRKAWRVVTAARQRVFRLRARLAHVRAAMLIPHRQEWLCIHRYEAPWNYDKDASGHNGYYDGGLQMDEEFQATYGAELLRRKGTADHWTPREQMIVAERAWKTRGFWPWPQTARYCGLL